jgi:hypothetical protein
MAKEYGIFCPGSVKSHQDGRFNRENCKPRESKLSRPIVENSGILCCDLWEHRLIDDS